MGSVLQNSESETIARNIMKILERTGDSFRPLSYGEYKEERLKDKNFNEGEQYYFEKVIAYCENPSTAQLFCDDWVTPTTEVIKIQVAKDTDLIIIEYFMTSTKRELDKEKAIIYYEAAEQVGALHGTDAFDECIEVILDGLGLDAKELTRLTTK